MIQQNVKHTVKHSVKHRTIVQNPWLYAIPEDKPVTLLSRLGFTACSIHPTNCLYLISFMKCHLFDTHSPPVHTLASHGSQVVAPPLASR